MVRTPGHSRVPSLALIAACCVLGATLGGRWLWQRLSRPPRVEQVESYLERADGPRWDHSALDAVLRKHVDDEGRVDYRGLEADSGALDAYIRALAKAPVDAMARSELLCLLINAYNACTLRLILDHYPVPSIMDIPAAKRWDAVRWNLGGSTYSLNQVEHEQIRPHFAEPRIHFALVCAARGCPPLRNEAYVADRLEPQLDQQARRVHADPRWFLFDAGPGIVNLTRLYDWYPGDFEQAAGGILPYAARYSRALAESLSTGRRLAVRYLDYDWALNAR